VTEDSGGLVPHYRLAISRHDGHSLECVVTGTEVTRDPGWTTQSYGMTEGAGMVESSLVRAGERRADAVSGADLALGFRRLLRLSSVATAECLHVHTSSSALATCAMNLVAAKKPTGIACLGCL
jgi:hypothetical protein